MDRDIAGQPIHQLAATVGFVFQNPDDQLFNRSVEREVRFGPRNLGLEPKVADALVEQALDATGLAGDRAANPYDLNVSSRKLVALASVLATEQESATGAPSGSWSWCHGSPTSALNAAPPPRSTS